MALSEPTWLAPGERVVVQVPLTAALSKNAQHRVAKGRLYLTPEAQAERDALAWALRAALRGRRCWPRCKVWLALEIQRADLRSDPINVLDAVADAVRDAIGVDDRWFAIARLDWTVVRGALPWLRVTLWQEVDSANDNTISL